ncbi:purine-nucleoside phosphorylase [Luteibaculum oceani]|uniref:Purine nucleoside phosphorylase n=1 Tax=Luteibaculum oceani TaxID=1294296 RepID=A0A5C6UXM1_9FLAO|nr:purine-nucleoside phosphorylase [Luteibaculum oceani]TXC76991.1 purine-nucleoside phosphorylase [Luteibaculum oceani]
MNVLEKINEAVSFLEGKQVPKVGVGIILGTGLGNLLEHVEIINEISYSDIPHFPVSTVEFHKGKLIHAKHNGKEMLIMNGRFHYYEGYSMEEVVFPVRVMRKLGVTKLLISNAAGAVNLDFSKGNLMVIDDHINLQSGNPLRGENFEEIGPRFPDMSQPYSRNLQEKIHQIAVREGVSDLVKTGVYVAVDGPNLETRAEYRYLGRIGADAVGMSTVPEVIAANHAGMEVAAVSVLTDECDPDNLAAVDIADIIAVAGKAEKVLSKLFLGLIEEL